MNPADDNLTVSVLDFVGRDPTFARAVRIGYTIDDIYLNNYKDQVTREMMMAVTDLVWDRNYPCDVVVLGLGCNILKEAVMRAVGSQAVVIDSYSAGLNELAGVVHALARIR